MPACLLACLPPLSSPASSTPPPRYRYHNNGIIAIPAACYTMTLAKVRRGSPQRTDRIHTRKRKTEPRSARHVISAAAFSALHFAEGHSAISVSRGSPPLLLVRFAQPRARASQGCKQAGARKRDLVYKQNARLLRSKWNPRGNQPARFQPGSFYGLYYACIYLSENSETHELSLLLLMFNERNVYERYI